VYQNSNAAADNYVKMTLSDDVIDSNVTMHLVTITISHKVSASIPAVSGVNLGVHAAARYA
jgi:hypothetical protein